MINVEALEEGDAVIAAIDMRNDGSLPDQPDEALLVEAGSRGVIIRKGHLEDDPNRTVFLVRFEDRDRALGPPIGCWPEELSPPSH
ncbi:MAG: nitrogen fixation protein NifZ [Methylotetracoccus sp.]